MLAWIGVLQRLVWCDPEARFDCILLCSTVLEYSGLAAVPVVCKESYPPAIFARDRSSLQRVSVTYLCPICTVPSKQRRLCYLMEQVEIERTQLRLVTLRDPSRISSSHPSPPPTSTPLTTSTMSRARAAFGIGIAAFCGIVTAYATLQPEFEKQQAERNGDFKQQHVQDNNDQVISQAIISDMKEAKHQVEGEGKGIAWGIREAIWGRPEDQQRTTTTQQNNVAQDRGQGTEANR